MLCPPDLEVWPENRPTLNFESKRSEEMVHRKLTRTADHHASLLKNLVTNVIEHESITTTHAKAKEAQTAVERVITGAKRLNSQTDRFSKDEIHHRTQLLKNKFFKHDLLYPKLMGELLTRYASFTGGYTRILKLEPRLGDNAPQSILELVGGKRDMRFAMTARAVARANALGEQMHPMTVRNMRKLTKTEEEKRRFEEEVEAMKLQHFANIQQGQESVRETVRLLRRAPIEIKPNPLSN